MVNYASVLQTQRESVTAFCWLTVVLSALPFGIETGTVPNNERKARNL
jgi:hypothetical protein